MSALIEDYLREVQASLRVDATRKRQIADELRTHLTERVADELADDPSRPRDDVEREVLRDFGNPRDLALAYEPEGGEPVLLNQSGDIVLRLGRASARAAKAVGRGTTKVLKVTAIVLAGLLVVALGVGAWAYYEIKPYIPTIVESQEPVYSYSEGCATACSGAYPPDTFSVREGAETVRFDLRVRYDHDWETDERVGAGNVTVRIADPSGALRFERTLSVDNETRFHHEASWASMPGNWTASYEFDGFVGHIELETYAYGFPRP